MNVRFGIIGAGFIADAFASDAILTGKCKVVAVATRSLDKAKEFASKHDIGKYYDDYNEMLEDDSIDAIYIASPHVFHKEHTIAALKSKKAVLCEKPFAMNTNDAKDMLDTARDEDMLLMEGMWSRFFPAYHKMKILLDEVGEIQFIKADFGFRSEELSDTNRLLNPELGGGALFDVGVYPISIVRDIMGCDPIKIQCTQFLSDLGVDLMSTYNYTFKDGALACLYSAIQVKTQTELFVSGTKGTLHMPNFFCPEQLIYTRHNGYQEAYNYPKVGFGYTYEISHFCDLFIKGKLESPIMSLSETMAIMNMLDQIQVKIGYLQK